MFSWSTNSRKGKRSSGGVGDYPGAGAAATTNRAQTIQGSIRPPEFTREQHLDSYIQDDTLKRSTRKVSVDDSTYDTVFQTTSGDALILRVHFPKSSRPPQMTLVGVLASHNWLDRATMRVIGYPSIQSDMAWKHARALLGHAVREVVTHLQLNPPTVLEVTDPGLAKMQSSLGRQSNNNNKTNNNNSNGPPDYDTLVNSMTPPPPVDMPTIPTQFHEELKDKSREELQQILNDELEFLTIANTIPVHQEIQLQRESMLDENAKLATTLLERQEEYAMLHGQVSDLKESLATKLQEFTNWQQQQDEFMKPPHVNVITKELNRVRKKSYSATEDLATDWVDTNGTGVENFCKTFIEQRHIMHIRAAKLERLKYQT